MTAAMKNISSMLVDGGQGLLVFSQSSPMYKAYRKLSVMPRWKQYMMDVEDFIPCFQDTEDPITVLTSIMSSSGLRVDHLENPRRFCTFTERTLLPSYASCDPFVSRIPTHEKADYLDELRNLLRQFDPDGGELKYNFNILIARFTKCEKSFQ